MFEGASPIVFGYAKQLRKNMTGAEMVLWGYLKKGINGYKFRRQHPIGSFVADLYCHKLKLVIEVDGNIHEKEEIKNYDLERELDLKEFGCSIIRFTNDSVLNNVESVLETIQSLIEADIRYHTTNQK